MLRSGGNVGYTVQSVTSSAKRVQCSVLHTVKSKERLRAVLTRAASDVGAGFKGPSSVPDPVLGDTRIILVSPKTPGNIGSVCRVAACFEAPQVYIVAPRCDPFSGEAQMMASSCPQVLQGITVVHSLEEALADTQGSIGFTRRAGATRVTHKSLLDLLRADPQAIPCMVLPQQGGKAASSLLQQQPLGITGLVFGREESGLSEAEVHLCTHACAIPTGRIQGSMNLSHAVAAVQSELFQRRLLFLEHAEALRGQQGVADQAMHPRDEDPLLMGSGISGEPASATSSSGSHQHPWPSEQQGHEGGPPQARPATAGEVEALLKKMVTMAKSVGASTEESTGGGSTGSHGRRRKPIGHMRSILSKARPTQAEVRALHGFASQVLESLDKARGDN